VPSSPLSPFTTPQHYPPPTKLWLSVKVTMLHSQASYHDPPPSSPTHTITTMSPLVASLGANKLRVTLLSYRGNVLFNKHFVLSLLQAW